ncbi:betaine aldehyde dehydrogenase, NAD-dependent [uncultured Alphaproteobacteria bacterium]|uniref:Betaine aldehyde dehydrogenase, NAD-dependent n=1 Tax=uncultured Alphaproteobacteria bacterium TaxID=91750 RepID=A0A212JLV1_9PROT|nr:betaine aldehyde dehydrogenase, NAD-dependent [uncultured Alphaproteobacteria bacterium]
MIPLLTSHVGGGFLPPSDGETFETRSPFDGRPIARVLAATATDVDAAVGAARTAFATWSETGGAARGKCLARAAELIRARGDEIARLESLDGGKPISETPEADVASGADCFAHFAGIAERLADSPRVAVGDQGYFYTRREPLGVVGAIGAWNYPFQIACWKAAPALAAGNAVVFKPAELTPLSAALLAEILVEAGLPEGAFNVVQGDARVGRLLTAHPGIDKISFTGEVGTGKAVAAAGAATLKRVTLELGGKSALLVFADADLDDAVAAAMLGNFYTQGQICTNCTRVFVHRDVHDAFVDRLVARTRRLRLGDPLDPATQVGPLISPAHRDKVMEYVNLGTREGAKIAVGGGPPDDAALAAGNFVLPTVFTGCADDMTICREEIFGPVMSVLRFSDEAEAIARANALPFGLAAGAITADPERARRVARRLQAGVVWINSYNLTPVTMPFGGCKQSGYGRENGGMAAIAEMTFEKSVYVATNHVESPYR